MALPIRETPILRGKDATSFSLMPTIENSSTVLTNSGKNASTPIFSSKNDLASNMNYETPTRNLIFSWSHYVHQDLGQMQMYVNYYDRYVKVPEENPTIGILLCQKKNSQIVELTLPKDANIYASQYSLCLPDKKQLQNKLKEWVEEFEHGVEVGRPVKGIKKRLTGVKNE